MSILQKLHTVYCIFITGFATVVLFPVAISMMLFTLSRTGEMWLVANVWSQILIKSGGATLEVFGREHLDPKRPTIYVCNHQSTLDAPVLFKGLWPVPFRYIAKHTLKYVPVTGWYLILAGYIFIDRSNHRQAVKTLDKAAQQIRAGKSVLVFPEGTRSETGVIMPFKKGPFALAVKAGVAICPVTIEGSGSVMPKNSWTIKPGPIKLMIGAPIDPRPYGTDREKLARAVRDQIIEQSLKLGGKGGDKTHAIARAGKEGIGTAESESESESTA